jgi:hypothetical protein
MRRVRSLSAFRSPVASPALALPVRLLPALSLPILLLTAAQAFAQEGFPLDGTWRGTLSSASSERGASQVVLVMSWDGERINGVMNPGPRSTEFSRAVLDPSNWSVRIEAQPADAEPVVIEGTLEDIGSYNRYIEGTWTQGDHRQPVRITRE